MANATTDKAPNAAPAAATATAAPASGAPQQPFTSASLYVGDLAPEVNESILYDMFCAVGPVASVRVCRDHATRRSLGYAYVNFHRAEDAERALDTLNFASIRNRPCRIMWCHRDPSLRRSNNGNIFVKNLAPTIDHKTLFDTFSMFGNILSCKVQTNSKGESLGYGFVHYEADESAAQAIEHVNGMDISGQAVSVAVFKGKKERGGTEAKFTNVFIKNLPEDIKEEEFVELIKEHGNVTSHMFAVDTEGKAKGFGFANYSAPEEAKAAVDGINGKELRTKELIAARAQKKEDREVELRAKFETLKQERQKKYEGVNLYIKNISEAVTDERLRDEFKAFGTIVNATVMKDDAGKSKGFGFVCYTTPDEATKAVSEMNGKIIDSKPVYVAIAQRKEVRRGLLEAQFAARSNKMPQGMAYPPQAMFYPPQRVMYPPQGMVRRGWGPNAGPAGPGPRGPAPQMMPMQGYAGQVPVGRGAPTQNARGRGGRKGGRGGAPRNANPNPNYKYNGQVRNPEGAQQQQQAPAAAPAATTVPGGANQRLTIEALAKATPEQQKRMIGERLYPLIAQREPEQAGKITGMILEMDSQELLHLLEAPEARNQKIDEALAVLKAQQK